MKRFVLISAAVLLSLEALLWLTHFGALGYRKFKDNDRTAAGTRPFRVLALGESTTDTLIATSGSLAWPEELELLLNNDKSFNTRFRVINKGVSGVSSTYFMERIRRLICDCKPDLIISMIGVNDYSRAANTLLRRRWYSGLRLVRAFNWFSDFIQVNKDMNRDILNGHLNAEAGQLSYKAMLFLKDPGNHSEHKILEFGEMLKKDLPKDKQWLADDVMANLLGKFCYYARTKQLFPELKGLLVKTPVFYAALSRHFMLNLYHEGSVGYLAPNGFFFYPAGFIDKELKDYQKFLAEHIDHIVNPAVRDQVVNSIGSDWMLDRTPAGRYMKLRSIAESYQNNYLYIIDTARENGVPIFPMQYPRIPVEWLRAVVQGEEIAPGDVRIFCSPWKTVKPGGHVNQDLVLISNEDLGRVCTPQNSNCFLDNFHYCQDPRYTFGHAGPLLNKIIAENAYKAIKENRGRLFPK